MNIAIPLGNSNGFTLLTNEGLCVGDKVFPCVGGYHSNGKFYVVYIRTTEVLQDPDWVLACTGWPSEPHVVEEFYSHEGLLHIKTNRGYSPAEVYFKVIK